MTSAGSQPPGPESPSPLHTETESAGINAHGEALLASLIGFFRPSTSSSDITRLCTSAEGQQFLKTLGNFVNLVVNSGVDIVTEGREDVAPSHVEEHFHEDQPNETLLATESLSDVDKSSILSNLADVYPQYALPIELIDEVNNRVFNEMPIRLISFDKNGNNCTLVERSELVEIILARIKADYPSEHKLELGIKQANKSIFHFTQKYCRYAILSHTWLRCTPGDILFHDWANRAHNTRGNDKITNFCSVAAREHSVRFGWMDTVCINKESSSELDESIRSMYKWYQKAQVCIAYLADTLKFAEIPKDTWFTRGWTLQELLANSMIYFYNRDWAKLHPGPDFTEHLNNPEFRLSYGSRGCMLPQMQYQIFIATSITPAEVAPSVYSIRTPTISRIMELAARRKVTRVEDHIYSLMGLLDVSIPIAYGEGPKKALTRMVREIMLSRPYFLDLFNHTNKYSILPENITDYIGCSKTPRYLVRPKTPLVLSHLGIHATLIAIPLFNKDLYPDFPANNSMDSIPFGRNSYSPLNTGNTSTEWMSRLDLLLSAQSIKLNDKNGPPFYFLAILGSEIGQDNDTLRISVGDNVGIRVFSDSPHPINETVRISFTDIKPSDPLFYKNYKYTGLEGPVRINLSYSGPNVLGGILKLTTAEAKKMGFKVISAYFP